ncbi:MAG: type II toxin-antitoxin system Phd/YefM family antitoxin [Candidatus Hydrogenedentes bacterium]|nr:type II toxin-antitoxin system Phd/YefM family antitoxin [Candidatus Hydrogenedentota bacterium]
MSQKEKPMAGPVVYRIPITKARVNLGQVTRRVQMEKECFILERDGIPVAGIIGIDELEDYLELRDPKLSKQIRQSYKSYRQGMAKPIDHLLDQLESPSKKRVKKTR